MIQGGPELRIAWLILFFLVVTGEVIAASAPTPKKQTSSEQGMVIRGDQEAPLVLYIVPWQESQSSQLPDAPRVPLIPKVLDHERGLADDPANWPLGHKEK